MAKKPTEKQLYKLKNEWLGQFFEEVKPKEFYRAVFPEGSFERAGHFEDGQNARLCARLTGYNTDIRPESGYYGEEEPKKEAETDAE